MKSYNRIMDSIKADDAFKAQLKSKLSTVRPKPLHLRILPYIKRTAAACAVIALSLSIGVFFRDSDNASTRIMDPQSSEFSTARVLHVTFDGFEKYDIEMSDWSILIPHNISREYTLTHFISDVYKDFVDDGSELAINDGMLDSFAGIDVSDDREIHVYVNDREIMNTNRETLLKCFDGTDAYLKVTVTD